MRTVTIQPSPLRLTSVKPQPRIRVTCPTYIGDQRNERGLTIRDNIQASIDSPSGFCWGTRDLPAVREFIQCIADPTGALGLGVVVA